MYISYISVSISTPLAVTGPHGQLASLLIASFCCRLEIITRIHVLVYARDKKAPTYMHNKLFDEDKSGSDQITYQIKL